MSQNLSGIGFAANLVPFPYRSAIAISSDCEFLTGEALLDLHRLLSGPTGLGLEVTQSMFFYTTQALCHSSIGYFEGTSFVKSRYSDLFADMICAGHVDTVHAYGDFDAGGYERAHGERVADELEHLGAKLPIYSNHGSALNTQNMGHSELTTYQQGDNPDHPSYHIDLLKRMGGRYIWVDNGLTTQLGGPEPLLYDAIGRDNTPLKLFRRFRGLVGKAAPNAGNLSEQMTPDDIDAFIDRGGCAVVYQHFGVAGKNPDNSFDANIPPYFEPPAMAVIEHLAARNKDKSCLSAGTGRLLRFVEVAEKAIALRHENGDLAISIALSDVTSRDLEGLSFDLSAPPSQILPIKTQSGTIASSGAQVTQTGADTWIVSFPWHRLGDFTW